MKPAATASPAVGSTDPERGGFRIDPDVSIVAVWVCCACATDSQVAYGPASIMMKARTAHCQRVMVMSFFPPRSMIARQFARLKDIRRPPDLLHIEGWRGCHTGC